MFLIVRMIIFAIWIFLKQFLDIESGWLDINEIQFGYFHYEFGSSIFFPFLFMQVFYGNPSWTEMFFLPEIISDG